MKEIREIEHSLKALTNLKNTVETQAQKIKQLESAAMKQRHIIHQQQRFLQVRLLVSVVLFFLKILSIFFNA